MIERTVQVSEKMAGLIGWMNVKGRDAVNEMIQERLAEIKKEAEEKGNKAAGWDDIMEPSDGADQWKQGGDCNLCRKAEYCGTKCRANKLLKKAVTPYLYQKYIDENPEAAAKSINPSDLTGLVQMQ